MLSTILWGVLVAASLLVGFYLSSRGLSNRTIGMVRGFGAGALLSAIAYERIPESLMQESSTFLALFFTLGAFTFFGIDWWIDHRGGADLADVDLSGAHLSPLCRNWVHDDPRAAILAFMEV